MADTSALFVPPYHMLIFHLCDMVASHCPPLDASSITGTGGPLVFFAPRGLPFTWAVALLCDCGLPILLARTCTPWHYHSAGGRRPFVMSAAPSASDVIASPDTAPSDTAQAGGLSVRHPVLHSGHTGVSPGFINRMTLPITG